MRRVAGATMGAAVLLAALGTAAGAIGVERDAAEMSGEAEVAERSMGGVMVQPAEAPSVIAATGDSAGVVELLGAFGITADRVVGELVQAELTADAAAELASSPLVSSVVPLAQASSTGPIQVIDPAGANEADAAEGLARIGALAWQAAGYGGRGVRVAVVDTGFADWARAEAAGVVPTVAPGDTLDLCDRTLDARTHGTATAEVLHAVAPDAGLVRVCIDDALDLVQATDWLLGADVDIVNMALGFFNTARGDGSGGPGSPDASVRRALDGGLVWVNSAGNQAPLHYRAAFADAEADGLHAFAPAVQEATFTVPGATDTELFLRWDQWPPQPVTDRFELCLGVGTDPAVSCLGGLSPDRGTPTTGVALTNPGAGPVTFRVSIRRVAGTSNPVFDLFLKDAVDWQFPVASSSLVEPATVPGAVAVGASCTDTGEVQPASSQGPTADGRPGITVVAPGAVSGLLFGSVASCRGGYGGTSAAAPHVAGALALLRQLDVMASGPELVAELLTRSESLGDPGAPGIDPVYGHGQAFLGEAPPYAPPTDGGDGTGLQFSVGRSQGADRSAPQPLAGTTISGDVYVFLLRAQPEVPIAEVRFFVDEVLQQVEREAGYDLGGGQPHISYPFDTFRVGDGGHRLAAVVTLADGTVQVVITRFSVDNEGVTRTPAVGTVTTGGVPLDGLTLTASAAAGADLTLAPADGTDPIDHVRLYVDAVEVGIDGDAPFSITAGAFAGLSSGQHMTQLAAIWPDGTLRTANATFTIT